MKALLICPGTRPAVALLSESCPLAVAPLLGKCLVEYWIEHVAALGVSAIQLVASDRAAQIHATVGDGARWGLAIQVTEETRELSAAEATARYGKATATPPDLVVRLDHLPGQAGLPLFESYAGWFAALQAWIPRAQTLERIGQCEVRPGVWVGLRPRIDRSVRLLAPCWLGDYVTVNSGAVIGPAAVLEDGVVVAAEAQVARSVIGPATYVGAQTRIDNSLARHHTLISWTTGSCLRVPDAFWLSSLANPLNPTRPPGRPLPMKIEPSQDRLNVSEFSELSAANASGFRQRILAAFSATLGAITIDFSCVQFVDSNGLAALNRLHRDAGALGISVHVVNPPPSIRQLIEIAQMERFLETDQAEPVRTAVFTPEARRSTPSSAMIAVHG